MKNIVILLVAITFSAVSFAQKTKKSATKSNSNKTILAKGESVTAELLKGKSDYQFYMLLSKTGSKDTLALKTIPIIAKAPAGSPKDDNLPTNCMISSISVKGTPLTQIAWTEKSYTEIPDKKQDKTNTVTEIWNLETKTQLFSNTQSSTKITEILWLDKVKNASQTSEKMRNEGFVMSLSSEGDIILKNKTQENRMSYDVSQNKFIAIKSAMAQAPAPAASKVKKKR